MSANARTVEAIQFHYDVGNAFYRLWLDSRMVYSCAMWDEGVGPDDLESAQLRKLDYHIDESRANIARRVLDVGGGWGGLLVRCLERNPQIERAVALTLSAEQKRYVDGLAARHPALECRLENWLDHRPDQPYDAIISIGAFEHFAAPGDDQAARLGKYRRFFEFCAAQLRPKGKLSLQTIAYLNLRRENASKFMQNEIFPDSDLPYPAEILEAAHGVLEIQRVRNDRTDYGRTCSLWAQRLKARRAEATSIGGEALVRRFETYLQLSSVGFYQAKLCLLRITAQKL